MMQRWLERASQLALIFWAVTTWVTGYVFAPVMFASFDKIQAGLNTGELLHATYVMSMLCAVILLIDFRVRFKQKLAHHTDLWLTISALLMVLVQFVGISPKMITLKQTMLNNPADASAFMQLHGVSQIVYLITSLLLVALVWRRVLR